jgi:DNA-directed RNA polymerase subunit RPC12/RpoP
MSIIKQLQRIGALFLVMLLVSNCSHLGNSVTNQQKLIECSECTKKFNKQDDLDKHYEAKHDGFECPECDKEFNNRRALDQHWEAKHKGFECPKCGVSGITSQEALGRVINWSKQQKQPSKLLLKSSERFYHTGLQ